MTTLSAQLGVSVSSLERVLICHRNQASTTSATSYSIGNRATAGLQQYFFTINSQMFPDRPILVADKGAEIVAESLVADHALVDLTRGGSINNGVTTVSALAGTVIGALGGIKPSAAKANAFMIADSAGLTAGEVIAAGAVVPDTANVTSDIGTFLAICDLESNLAAGRSSNIYSGISTLASTVTFNAQYSAVPSAMVVDFFSQFSVLMSLDMRGSGVWSVSI